MQYYGGKIFEGKHRSREMHRKWIYACLVGTADSKVQRSAVVEPRLPILPIHKPNNKAQINN